MPSDIRAEFTLHPSPVLFVYVGPTMHGRAIAICDVTLPLEHPHLFSFFYCFLSQAAFPLPSGFFPVLAALQSKHSRNHPVLVALQSLWCGSDSPLPGVRPDSPLPGVRPDSPLPGVRPNSPLPGVRELLQPRGELTHDDLRDVSPLSKGAFRGRSMLLDIQRCACVPLQTHTQWLW
jgi:hypothetical protein